MLMSFLISLFTALLATPLTIWFGRTFNLVDRPDPRKIHRQPIPRVGGVAIFAGIIAGLIPILVNNRAGLGQEIWLLLGTITAMFVVGFVDDLRNISSKIKLAALLIAAGTLCYNGVRVERLSFGDLGSLNLGVLSWPISILWIVGITAAMNFIDGLDGLASGIGAIGCCAIAVVAFAMGHGESALLNIALMGALIGFLFFNFNPAKIFMGDCGSMLIGFLLGASTLSWAAKCQSSLAIVVPAMALGVPVVDTLMTVFRRAFLQRRSIFAAERGHVHHGLLDRGLSQKKAVFMLYAVSIASAILGVMMHGRGWKMAGVILFADFIVLAGLFRHAGLLKVKQMWKAIWRWIGCRRSAGQYRKRFEDIQLRFNLVKDFDSWWTEVKSAAELLDLSSIELPLPSRDGKIYRLTMKRDLPQGSRVISVQIPINHRRLGAQPMISVELPIGATPESTGERVALFVRLMEEHSIATLPQNLIQARATGHPESVVVRTAASAHARRICSRCMGIIAPSGTVSAEVACTCAPAAAGTVAQIISELAQPGGNGHGDHDDTDLLHAGSSNGNGKHRGNGNGNGHGALHVETSG